jgi:hypothetical protein
MNRIEASLGRGGQLGQHCCDRLRVRDHAVIVEMLAKRGMWLGVPNAEVGIRRVVLQPFS